MRTPPEKLIVKKFSQYNSQLSDVWSSYCFINGYLPQIHNLVKNDKIETIEVTPYAGITPSKQSKTKTYGIISHIQNKTNPSRALIDAVSYTEVYLQYLATVVYRHFPEKLSSNSPEAPERLDKVINVILDSHSKDEMIERLIEEKVRSIFYGNPAQFFLNDKAKLGFGNYFKSCHNQTMVAYQDILAFRNVFTHYDGKADRKFLREFSGSGYKLGQKINVSHDFLRESLLILRGLSANAAFLVIRDTINVQPLNKKLIAIRKSFNKAYETN